jgi:hypothetical protein
MGKLHCFRDRSWSIRVVGSEKDGLIVMGKKLGVGVRLECMNSLTADATKPAS